MKNTRKTRKSRESRKMDARALRRDASLFSSLASLNSSDPSYSGSCFVY